MRPAIPARLALGVVFLAATLSGQLIGTNIDTTIITPDGPLYMHQSLPVGGFSVTSANLDVGSIRGSDASGNCLGSLCGLRNPRGTRAAV